MSTAPATYYLPTPEKLAGLGYSIEPDARPADCRYTKPVGSKGHFSISLGDGEDGWIDFTEARYESDFREWPSMKMRVRSEAEFDLLLWQIGWTDVEPDVEVTSGDELRGRAFERDIND